MVDDGQQLLDGRALPPMRNPADVAGAAHGGGNPRIEVVTGQEPAPASEGPNRSVWSLILWFLGAFLLVMVPATLWNYSREPVYRATASVLTTVPASRSGYGVSEPDVQHVAIQRRVLLGRALLTDLLERIEEDQPTAPATPDDLLPMLAVGSIPGTNLVELSAEGGQPLLLSDLVNAWLEAYEGQRQAEIEARVGTQLSQLGDETDALAGKIADKRAALERFRQRFDIVTLERDNNRALKRLNTLQDSLATAEDEQIKAKAKAAAVQASLARGEPVISEKHAATLAQLAQRESELEVRVKQLRKRYTEMFIQNDPDKRALPDELARVRARIETVREQGTQATLADALREQETATDRLFRLQREFAEQKRIASSFTQSFSEYQTLQEELDALEAMQRETETERVSLETSAIEDYPQIEVITPASPPRDPVRPLYLRDLGLSAGAAGAAGTIVVIGLLLFDAARRPRPSGPMTGVRIWDDGPARQAAPEPAPALAATPAPTAIGGSRSERGALQAPMAGLPDGIPRQLMGGEVEAIWEIAANPERQLMGLLLCGMSETELAALRADDFDLEGGTVSVPGDGRSLALPPLLTLELSQSGALPAWGSAAEAEDLGHRITLLAHDVGIAHADEVTPAVLRHTYLTYLVRQGARLTELDRIAGAMDTATIRRYAPLSPAGASRPLEQLDLTYPLFG